LFEGGELAPAGPIVVFQAAVDSHGGDIAVGAPERTVARGREGMCESRLCDETCRLGEDTARWLLEDLKTLPHCLYSNVRV
jgi:hypothetical protein